MLKKTGKLNAETVLIEPTSGNTVSCLLRFGVARGYKIIIVMAVGGTGIFQQSWLLPTNSAKS